MPAGDAGRFGDLPVEWPEQGETDEAVLDRLASVFLDGSAHLGHPGYFAHMDPPTPVITWATSAWAASRNQNLLHPDASAVAAPIEDLVLGWLAPRFGMAGGHMVPGSTVANLTALWAARDLAGVTEVVASEAAHLSVAKAAHILGLSFRSVPVDAEQRLLAGQLGDLRSSALVLTAGTVAAGAVDPLEAGADAAWRHVDAAWAGPLRLTKYDDLLDGVEQADSVGVSAHKWLYQPKDAGVVLFADVDAAHDALSYGGGYLSKPNVGVVGSRGAAALSLLATLLRFGRAGLAELIEADMARAQQLAATIRDAGDLELALEPVTGVVLWRPTGLDARAVRAELDGAWVSLAEVASAAGAGEWWLRSVAANPMADVALVVDEVRQAAARVRASTSPSE